MAVIVRIQTVGLDRFDAKMNRIAREIEDMTGIVQGAALATQTSLAEGFRNQVDPDNSPWAPTSEFTLRSRAQGTGTGSAKTLWDTGLLAQSVTSARPELLGRNNFSIITRRAGARANNYGATIRPVQADKLAIPANRAARLGEPGGRIVMADEVVIPKRTFLAWGSRVRGDLLEFVRGVLKHMIEEQS